MSLKRILIMKYNPGSVTKNCNSSIDSYGAKLDTALVMSSIY
jgi:hypothetical protein